MSPLDRLALILAALPGVFAVARLWLTWTHPSVVGKLAEIVSR